ncbi:MAG: histidine kinase [Lachnospiraceae bacterium]|nr:histidine kinase [Lachnospiraceae bacterium]
MDYVWAYVEEQYLLVMALISVALIARLSLNVSEKEQIHLYVMILLILLQSVCSFSNNIIVKRELTELYRIRLYILTANYILRPIIIALLGDMILRYRRASLRLYFLPCLLNTAVYTISVYTGSAFSITPDNVFVEGRFFHTANVVSVIYLIIMVIYSISLIKGKSGLEQGVILAVMIELALGIAMDIMASQNNMNLTIVMAFVTYLLCLYVERNNERLKEKEAELVQKENELMMSQIQPHFIYNTLNVIYRLCQVNPTMAGETIIEFSNYLRSNLETSSEARKLVDIEKEILHAKFYSDIEKLRFPYLEVKYELEDKGYLIPPLTVQPMVENAVRHGVRGMKDGSVIVKTFIDGNSHVIMIKDNGIGKVEEKKNFGKHRGIGIKNVTDRIESFCHGTVEINMVEGEGTTVYIKIPVNEEFKNIF